MDPKFYSWLLRNPYIFKQKAPHLNLSSEIPIYTKEFMGTFSNKLGKKKAPTFANPKFGPPREFFWQGGQENITFVNMLVTRIESPSLLFLQNTTQKIELDNLVESMSEFYNNFYENFKVEKDLKMEIGSFCAAYDDEYDKWYRGVIEENVSNGPSGEHLVRHLDYGSNATCPYNSVFPLRPSDLELPIQAISASLYHESDEMDNSLNTAENERMLSYTLGGKIIQVASMNDYVFETQPFLHAEIVISNEGLNQTENANSFFDLGGAINLTKLMSR